jgi:RHS repeat-associated protein
MPVAIIKPSGVFYVHSDYRGTPRQIDDASGTAVWLWSPTSFGGDLPSENPLNKAAGNFVYNLRFPGQYYDSETGLHYNYLRDYNPRIGRYVESDPIGLRGGANLYVYVGNSPIDSIDLQGLVIYYANHSVIPGISHSLIVIIPDDQAAYANDPRFQNFTPDGLRYATIGAGPDSMIGSLFGAGGDLIAAVNRPTDVNGAFNNKQALALPDGFSDENEAISALFSDVSNYDMAPVPYTLFPSAGTAEYNSNSFISGLLSAEGFDLPNTGAYTPGFGNPVPSNDFASPQSSGSGGACTLPPGISIGLP